MHSFIPPEQSESSLLSCEGKLPVAWVTPDISKSGVIGDATTATKEKGDRILKSVANGWVQVIQDIYAYRQLKVDGKVGQGLTRFTQS